MSFDEYIRVVIDLNRACDAIGVPSDERRLLNALFAEPALSEREACAELGFSLQRTERVRRSLRPDRRIGSGLRRFLKAYSKRPSENKFVPKTKQAA